jgi:hypothetical protein
MNMYAFEHLNAQGAQAWKDIRTEMLDDFTASGCSPSQRDEQAAQIQISPVYLEQIRDTLLCLTHGTACTSYWSDDAASDRNSDADGTQGEPQYPQHEYPQSARAELDHQSPEASNPVYVPYEQASPCPPAHGLHVDARPRNESEPQERARAVELDFDDNMEPGAASSAAPSPAQHAVEASCQNQHDDQHRADADDPVNPLGESSSDGNTRLDPPPGLEPSRTPATEADAHSHLLHFMVQQMAQLRDAQLRLQERIAEHAAEMQVFASGARITEESKRAADQKIESRVQHVEALLRDPPPTPPPPPDHTAAIDSAVTSLGALRTHFEAAPPLQHRCPKVLDFGFNSTEIEDWQTDLQRHESRDWVRRLQRYVAPRHSAVGDILQIGDSRHLDYEANPLHRDADLWLGRVVLSCLRRNADRVKLFYDKCELDNVTLPQMRSGLFLLHKILQFSRPSSIKEIEQDEARFEQHEYLRAGMSPDAALVAIHTLMRDYEDQPSKHSRPTAMYHAILKKTPTHTAAAKQRFLRLNDMVRRSDLRGTTSDLSTAEFIAEVAQLVAEDKDPSGFRNYKRQFPAKSPDHSALLTTTEDSDGV